MNLPTTLTVFRILSIPLVIGLYFTSSHWGHVFAAICFIIAAITDWLDGYLARTLKQTSRLGEFLDPVADKLIVAIVLIVLVSESPLPYLTLPAVIIVGREITVSALREWMSELGKRASVAVGMLAKIKTAIQLTAISGLLLYNQTSGVWLVWFSEITIYLAAALTLWSMFIYLRLAWPDLTLSKESQ